MFLNRRNLGVSRPYTLMIALFFASGILPSAFAQGPDTIVGCLARTDRSGYYSLRQNVGGPPVQVSGDLDRYVTNAEVRVRGSIQREGNLDVFRVTSAEQLTARCPETSGIPDSMEELRESVGAATFGIRGGIGFDPELIYLGAHAQLGPFVRSVWFRPSYEFGFGEVTQMQSLNLEFAYYLPFTARSGASGNTWNTYVGAGPAFHLVRQDFEVEDEDFDFDDWDFDTGLNFLMGVSRRNGFFTELRGGAYGSPSIKIVVGYNFR
jgi:hypothetical protein